MLLAAMAAAAATVPAQGESGVTSLAPTDTPTPNATSSDCTQGADPRGATTATIGLMVVVVFMTYYLVIHISHRATAGEQNLLPHLDLLVAAVQWVADRVRGSRSLGRRRYSTLSFDDDDADEGNALHPHAGAGVDPAASFSRRERAAATLPIRPNDRK
jgi:hypothetical protein